MADATTQATGATNTPAGEGTDQAAAAARSGTERTYTQAEVDELLSGYVAQERVDEMVSALHTQDEVNRLVGEARKKVREQFEGYSEYKAHAEAWADYDEVVAARDRALAEVERLTRSAERRDLLDRVSQATGVPGSLLKGDTEEELTASAEAVRAYAGAQQPAPAPYPEDKGGGANPAPLTREQILAEPDTRTRRRLIAENIALFQQ